MHRITPSSPDGPILRDIDSLAKEIGLGPGDYEPYGRLKAKLVHGLAEKLADRPLAKYIGVTAINPTPLGEGKTVTAIGLAMALSQLGHATIGTLREPSLAPVFGIKGGGAGGGNCTLEPQADINLHFTGDMHAVTSATNLLASIIDNHIARRKLPEINPKTITWKRALDLCDKGLAHIISGLDQPPQAPLRETGFDLTAASEVMAILALANDPRDLRLRLGRIVVGMTFDRQPVTVEQLGCAGAMAALLVDALRPNLVQSCEATPFLVHSGPFGNIAHGNSSIIADQIALRLADYVVTESGFGADCGAEKFFDIKCRTSGLQPDAEVLVCTARALKLQSGQFDVHPGKPLPEALLEENLDALHAGAVNLRAHLDIIQQYHLPTVVAINAFPDDSERELEEIQKIALEQGASAAVITRAFSEGGEGSLALAEAVVQAAAQPNQFQYLYPLEMPIAEKIETIATRIYGAASVEFEPLARRRMQEYEQLGYGDLPICIAKTQYSLSHDPHLLGRPSGFTFPVRDLRLSAGAGFLYALSGEIRTMPGLPSEPAALRIDIDDAGKIIGLH
ncbi:formate--tetrahydrofolate ligase [Gimesia panareensis]|uniref:formate--tetrahydrofolate ligase n=1 Tax=Gimesia panareensis TaxID=2527978 RepID=UPI00118B3834|nr:formate--tetrahydrofolate ligase [Gimesia panareensis]QDU52543.1 Formate--tetrahydrofolate ligase [Gimesia panareensis]